MTESTVTDVAEVLQALGSGLLADRIGVALSEIALQTCLMQESEGGKVKGKLILTLEVQCQDPANSAMRVTHKLVKVVPHKTGKRTDETHGASVLYAGRGGRLSEIMPSDYLDVDQETPADYS